VYRRYGRASGLLIGFPRYECLNLGFGISLERLRGGCIGHYVAASHAD